MATRQRKATDTPSGAEPEKPADADVPVPADDDEPDLEAYEQARLELVAKLDAEIEAHGMPKTIYGKLAMVTGLIGQVRKSGRNTFHNYSYAKESDLVEAIRPLLARLRIFVWWSLAEGNAEQGIVPHERLSQTKRDRQGNVTGESDTLTKVMAWFKFIDDDGNATEPQLVAGYGDDTGDKGLYKAYTGMEKYFLFKTFLVSTGDDPEGDARTDRRAEAREAGSGPNVNVQQQQRQQPARGRQQGAPQVTRGHEGGNAGQMVQGGRQAENLSPVEQLRRGVWQLNLKKAEDILPLVERLSGEKAELVEGQTPAQALPVFLSALGNEKILAVVGKVNTMVEAGNGAEAVPGGSGDGAPEPAAEAGGTAGAAEDDDAAVAAAAAEVFSDVLANQSGWEDDDDPAAGSSAGRS